MIEHAPTSALGDAPAHTPALTLLGPHEAGMTTLAPVASGNGNAIDFDLEPTPFHVLEVGDRCAHEDGDRVATRVRAISLARLAREPRLAHAAT